MNMEVSSHAYPFCLAAVMWLFLLLAVGRAERHVSPVQKWGLGLIALGGVFILVGNLPLWSLALSFFPNPSILLMCLVMVSLWTQLTGRRVFRAGEWRAAWAFGAIAGSVLYFHSFLYGPIDLYFFGWDREGVIVCTALLGLSFLVNGNRFGIVFIGVLPAFGMDILESSNGWDYLIDPIYWLLGMGVCLVRGGAWLVRGSRARRISNDAVASVRRR